MKSPAQDVSSDRSYFVALASVAGIGWQTLQKILRWCEGNGFTLAEWWHSTDAHEASGVHLAQRTAVRDFQSRWEPEAYAHWLEKQSITPLIASDDQYPRDLLEFPHPPPILFGMGDLRLLAAPYRVAVIGTRTMTVYGQAVTTSLVSDLHQIGAVIISGGMYGVDQVAHETALATGAQTLAVIGYGHHHSTTASTTKLLTKIRDLGGLVLSEYPPWFPPNKGTFPARNRIVAGISDVVVVTEAGWESGSHITAHFAAEYGHEVCAVPGPVTSPMSDGAVRLIKEGAHVVRHAADVCALMGWPEPTLAKWSAVGVDQQLYKVLHVLSTGPQTSSQLANQLGWPEIDCVRALTRLQLEGYVVQYKSVWGLTRRIWHNGISA